MINKTYDWVTTGGLYAPSSYLQDLCDICINIYEKKFTFIISQHEIVKKLLDYTLKKINIKYPNFNEDCCKEHFIYIFRLLFKTKIYKYCKEQSKLPGSSNTIKPVPKLRILQNK